MSRSLACRALVLVVLGDVDEVGLVEEDGLVRVVLGAVICADLWEIRW